MSYRETFAEHVRICILRLLSELPQYQSNNSILADMVDDYGLQASRDFVNTQITWLEEQGLVRVRRQTPTLLVASLSDRGLDVAMGRSTVPGVKRRGPED